MKEKPIALQSQVALCAIFFAIIYALPKVLRPRLYWDDKNRAISRR